MSKSKQSEGVFEIERIRAIIELMEEHQLTEVDLQQGEDRIKLGRGGPPVVAAAAPVPMAAPAVAPTAPAAAGPVDDGTITINAPSVGTFYSRSNPDSDPFVKVGQSISPDTIVCIIEAMKVFNEIPAECSGTVVEVLVADNEAVDFGKPLFRIQPS
ncbi:MAG: acetyl-CoA carboxylase biotin carboxyl carrier protein [Planctomycetota bacterium]